MNRFDAAPNRRVKRKLRMRSHIEDAAYQLFCLQGVEGSSIEQICQAADVARRTFYSHFPNKQALLAGLANSRLHSQAGPMLRELMARHRTTRERLAAMIDYIEATFSRYQEIDRQLILVAPASFADHKEQQRQLNRDAIESFSALISAGQEAGDANHCYSAEILATSIVGTLNTLTVRWAIEPDYPIFARLEEAHRLFEAQICVD